MQFGTGVLKYTARLMLLAAAALLVLPACSRAAGPYPSRTVTLVVPYAPGGVTDTVGRLLADHLGTAWKTGVVVDNRPGGNAIVGTLFVAHAEPDGQTLLFGGASLSSYPALFKVPQVDALHDLTPISLVFLQPMVIAVSEATPASTLPAFIAYAKANPGKLNYGAAGGGDMLWIEGFNEDAGINLTSVMYKGEAESALAASRDDVQLIMVSPLSIKSYMQAGKVKALALSTATTRSRAVPQVPTSTEAGMPGLNQFAWFGILAPAGTPIDIRREVARQIAGFDARPDILEKLGSIGVEPGANTPEEFSKLIETETRHLVKVSHDAKVELQ